eukprot:EG_transcript_3298
MGGPEYCVSLGSVAWITATPPRLYVVGSVELVLKVTNLEDYGVPILCSSYQVATGKRWTVYAGRNSIYNAVQGDQYVNYTPSANVNDGQWHTLTLTGPVLTLDGEVLSTSFGNYLNNSISGFNLGFFSNRYVVSGGGRLAFRSIRFWNSSVVRSAATQNGELTFSSTGLVRGAGNAFVWGISSAPNAGTFGQC